MSNNNNNPDNAANSTHPVESIDQILNNIKDAITSNDVASQDVLVLTEQIAEDKSPNINPTASDQKPTPSTSESIIQNSNNVAPSAPDILDQLDAELPKNNMEADPAELSTINQSKDSEMNAKLSQDKKPIDSSSTVTLTDENNQTSPLVNGDVANAVKSSISSIMNMSTNTSINNNSTNLLSKSLEDVVVTLLKQEIQKWLNDNLENTVKQIVEHEIKQLMPK